MPKIARKLANSPLRAGFFHRLGEPRDLSFENQTYRASGPNLLVAAIILHSLPSMPMAGGSWSGTYAGLARTRWPTGC
jgi:hypothetical protein